MANYPKAYLPKTIPYFKNLSWSCGLGIGKRHRGLGWLQKPNSLFPSMSSTSTRKISRAGGLRRPGQPKSHVGASVSAVCWLSSFFSVSGLFRQDSSLSAWSFPFVTPVISLARYPDIWHGSFGHLKRAKGDTARPSQGLGLELVESYFYSILWVEGRKT